MPGPLSVRRYEPADAESVWRVHVAALRASPLPFVEDAPADADLRSIESSYLDAGGTFLVGEIDGADADWTASGDVDEEPDARIVAVGGYVPADEQTVELRHLRVHPAHRRRGYGRRVLGELEYRARTDGFEAARLETVEQLDAAISLYRDAGYEVVERDAHPETGDELLTLYRTL